MTAPNNEKAAGETAASNHQDDTQPDSNTGERSRKGIRPAILLEEGRIDLAVSEITAALIKAAIPYTLVNGKLIYLPTGRRVIPALLRYHVSQHIELLEVEHGKWRDELKSVDLPSRVAACVIACWGGRASVSVLDNFSSPTVEFVEYIRDVLIRLADEQTEGYGPLCAMVVCGEKPLLLGGSFIADATLAQISGEFPGSRIVYSTDPDWGVYFEKFAERVAKQAAKRRTKGKSK